MRKKDKGLIDQALGIIITVIFIVILVLGFMYYSSWIKTKNDIDATCRKYMLRMETDGYLTTQNKNDMTDELEDLGVININFNGTTLTEVPYGTKITLQVSGIARLTGISLDGGSLSKEFDLPVNIRKESISKN